MCGEGVQLFVDVAEQRSSKLNGGHGLLRARQGVMALIRVEEVSDYCKTVKEHPWFMRY